VLPVLILIRVARCACDKLTNTQMDSSIIQVGVLWITVSYH